MQKVDIFEKKASEYDKWFDKHRNLFLSELKALRKAIPENKSGIEIGVGTGRFAEKLSIKRGLDPSKEMARIANGKGIKTVIGKAENMPFKNNTFDYAVMITVDCFLENILKAFREVNRIIKPGGSFIIALIDKNSPLGKIYQEKKKDNPFYKHASFHSAEEISELLNKAGFKNIKYWQTLISNSDSSIEEPIEGYGEGGFVVIKASMN
ncbi:MAG TPA: class I SAM-dependent methyltransferase [Balneolaceae bacterium]|nr:class I SAM-dependent methyltransferase [Balneolaceae bacterium]